MVEFVFKAHPSIGPLATGVLVYPGSEIANIIKLVREWKEKQIHTERLTISFSRPAPHFKVFSLVSINEEKDLTMACYYSPVSFFFLGFSRITVASG